VRRGGKGLDRSKPSLHATRSDPAARSLKLNDLRIGAGTRVADDFCAFTILSKRGTAMNKDQLEGVGKKVKGKVNELVGKATGNTTQQIKGELQQGAGEVQKQYGNLKEDLKRGRP
jgi:uncharacterized protein YjbJ (UPF0337 family)